MGEREPFDVGEIHDSGTTPERTLTKAELKAAREAERKRKANEFRVENFRQSPHKQTSRNQEGTKIVKKPRVAKYSNIWKNPKV